MSQGTVKTANKHPIILHRKYMLRKYDVKLLHGVADECINLKEMAIPST